MESWSLKQIIAETGIDKMRITRNQERLKTEETPLGTLYRQPPLEVAAIIIDAARDTFSATLKKKVLSLVKDHYQDAVALTKRYPTFGERITAWAEDALWEKVPKSQYETPANVGKEPRAARPKEPMIDIGTTAQFVAGDTEQRPAAMPLPTQKAAPLDGAERVAPRAIAFQGRIIIRPQTPSTYRWNGANVRYQGGEIWISEFDLIAILANCGIAYQRTDTDTRIAGKTARYAIYRNTPEAHRIVQAFVANEPFDMNMVEFMDERQRAKRTLMNYY